MARRRKGTWIEIRCAPEWDDLLTDAAEQFVITLEGWHREPLTAVVYALRLDGLYTVGLVEIEDPDRSVPDAVVRDLARLEWHVLAPREQPPPDVAGTWSLFGHRVVWCWPPDPAARQDMQGRFRVRSEQYAGPRSFFAWQFSEDAVAFTRQLAEKLEEFEAITLTLNTPEQLALVVQAIAGAARQLQRSHAGLNCLPRCEEKDGDIIYAFALQRL